MVITIKTIYSGKVIHGFKRGSRLLGYPTANLDIIPNMEEGIYYGYATLNGIKYKAVMSVGLNPTFETKVKTFEVYIIHTFENDFYGEELYVELVDFIRNTVKCSSIEELINLIKKDVEFAILKLS